MKLFKTSRACLLTGCAITLTTMLHGQVAEEERWIDTVGVDSEGIGVNRDEIGLTPEDTDAAISRDTSGSAAAGQGEVRGSAGVSSDLDTTTGQVQTEPFNEQPGLPNQDDLQPDATGRFTDPARANLNRNARSSGIDSAAETTSGADRATTSSTVGGAGSGSDGSTSPGAAAGGGSTSTSGTATGSGSAGGSAAGGP